MMRWLNCVVFNTQEEFEAKVENRNGTLFFSHCDIPKPTQFPAYFELKDGYYDYWWPIDPKVMLSRWDAEIADLQEMRNKLEKIMLDKQ